MQFEAADWQYDVLAHGTPTVNHRLQRIIEQQRQLNGTTNGTTNGTGTANVTVAIDADTNSSTLVAAALPSILMNNTDVRHDIQNAAVLAATGTDVFVFCFSVVQCLCPVV